MEHTKVDGTPYVPRQSPFCTIDGCSKVSHSKSLCMTHYRRQLRTGNTDDPKPAICRMPGCNASTNARRLCMTHYQSLRRMAEKHNLTLDEVMPKGQENSPDHTDKETR